MADHEISSAVAVWPANSDRWLNRMVVGTVLGLRNSAPSARRRANDAQA